MVKKRARGEGSLFFRKDKGLWVAQIGLPDGRTRTKYAKLQKEARDWLLEQRTAIKDGLVIDDKKILFGDYLDRYMADVAAHTLRPKTMEGYVNIVNNHIKPALGKYPLAALTPSIIQKFYSDEVTRGFSRRTAQFCHAIIHKSLDQAMRWGMVPRNVADLVRAPIPDKRPPTIWTVDQVNIFLTAVADHIYYPAYLLAIYGGLRIGEVLGLHYEDIDWAAGSIHIRHAIQRVQGQGMVITDPKTKKSQRTVPMPEIVMNALGEYAASKNIDQAIFFRTRSGLPISPRNVERHFHDTSAALGLPVIRFHDLRHTSATLLLLGGVHPKVVQERLGHSIISTTMDLYSHVMPSMQRDASDKMAELLGTASTVKVQLFAQNLVENGGTL